MKPNHCCQNTYLAPILLPSEESAFLTNSERVETPKRNMFVLRKKQNGSCEYLDNKNCKCTIYDKQRPLECVIYPFLLDFQGDVLNVRLDNRFCPHLQTLKFDLKKVIAFVRSHQFPKDWIEGHNFLQEDY